MNNYKTVLEMSDQWGVTTRTVQNLCKNGEIKGAVKRAGSWFIPDDAPNPLKNTKLNDEHFNFVGTKKKIFDSSIELFMTYGFENVSMKDIADAVGIMQSAIYNHFSSKQKILDTMYDYYSKHFNDNKIPIQQMKEILKNGTKQEFCSALMFTFETENNDNYKIMTLLTKIIYMRFYQDDTAQDLFLNMMNADVENYVKEILEYGISIGVLEKFDIETYANFLVGQRHIMGMKAFANPNYELKQLDEEKRIMKMSSDMLPFVSPKGMIKANKV